MNIIVENGTIITMCEGRVYRDGLLVVEGQRIVDVGKSRELKGKYGRGYEKIDARRKIVIPGLINTHQHAAMSLLRGYADDLPLRNGLRSGFGQSREL